MRPGEVRYKMEMNGTTANQIGQALGMWAVIASLFFGLGLFGFSITAVILACLRRNRGWTVAAAISVPLVLGLLGAGAWASYTQFQKALMPKKVTAVDGIASLQVPGSWKELNNRNKDASIKQGNSFREEYMMVISESKDTLRGVELDDYTRMVCTQIEAGMKKATHAPIGPLVIHGLPACRSRLAGFSKSNLQLV